MENKEKNKQFLYKGYSYFIWCPDEDRKERVEYWVEDKDGDERYDSLTESYNPGQYLSRKEAHYGAKCVIDDLVEEE